MIILFLILTVAVAFLLDHLRIRYEEKNRYKESLTSKISAIERFAVPDQM